MIGPIVSNEAFFFVAIVALAGLMVLFDWRARQAVPVALPAGLQIPRDGGAGPAKVLAIAPLPGAERRKQLWESRREKLWTAAVCVSSFVFVILVTAEFIYAKNATALSPSAVVEASQGVVRIPVDSVSDGDLHRFAYVAGGVSTRFIVLKTGERLATALDACEICGAQGYYQKGASIMCKNCSSAIYGPTIGLVGGCNPVPLRSTVQGSELLIRASDLEAGSKFFAAREN